MKRTPTQSSQLASGATLANRYRVLSALGRGGTGHVFLARDQSLDRDVALKVLRPQSPQLDVERLLRGARSVAGIEHPHLVRIYDCGHDAEHGVYLVMERPRGETLSSLLRHSERLPIDTAIEIGRQLAAALSAMHAHHVVHRDVKPGNVLVDCEGPSPMVKLLDFGLARALHARDELTQAHALIGTWSYLAPERVQRGAIEPTAADTYSLGCVLYEMLSGAPPFAATTRSALLSAIAHDPARPLLEHGVHVPAPLSGLIDQCLAKNPTQRPAAPAIEVALQSLTQAERPTRTPRLPPLLAGGRLQRDQRIGAGAHGEVYSATDLRDGRQVVIKQVRTLGPQHVNRLKREFRTISGLHHPNLARCEELWVENDEAYFVMEWIEGVSLDSAAFADAKDLGAIFVQVASGLCHMHRAGLVHRDLKPAHVRINARGQVKLIDFSISARAGSIGDTAGTPHYRAPEAGHAPVHPALDVYAFGVMLRDALSLLPCDDSAWLQSAEHIATRCCADDPQSRPSAIDLVCALDPESRRPQDRADLGLVGRELELAQLQQACAGAGLQARIVVGESGIGKSALLDALVASMPSTSLVCVGACRASESVAFAAIDAALDTLCDHLEREPQLLTGLTLTEVASLLRWFPAFGRLHALAPADAQSAGLHDSAESFSRAHDALRRLLIHVTQQRRIVLILDDVHWIDSRTASLLAYVLRHPGPPALTLIGTRRPGVDVPAPELDLLMVTLDAQSIPLRPLSVDETGMLLARLGINASHTTQWWERTAGHPMFLLTLAASAHTSVHTPPTLQSALRARVERLDAPSRHALTLVCVTSVPLPRSVIVETCQISSELLHELTSLRLVRMRAAEPEALFEPYHASVSEAVLSMLSDEERRSRHRELATALAAPLGAAGRAPAMIEHLACSGATTSAVRLATDLASEAERRQQDLLAAALYAVAARHSSGTQRLDLLALQGEALHRGGQSRAAAGCLAHASTTASDERASRLRRRAGELALLSGDPRGGLALLSEAIDSAGLSLPTDVQQTLQQTFLAMTALRERGLALQSATPSPTAERVSTLDLLLGLAQGLSHVDLRALPLSFAALHAALDVGDPLRLLRACAIFVWNTASHFPTELVEPALSLARHLAETHPSPYAHALVHVATAEQLHFNAQFLAAELECEQAEHLLTTQCAGVARELAGVRGGLAFIQYAHKGDFRTWLPETLRWQADAELRKDAYHLNMLRSAHALVWIAQDDPERARRELSVAEASWPGGVSVFEVSVVLFLDVADRYTGRVGAPAQGRDEILQSPAAQTPFLRGYLLLHTAWGALVALASQTDDATTRAQLDVTLDELRALGLPLWQHMADALDANRAWLDGHGAQALEHLRRSEVGFRALAMPCLAASARHRRGELMGGPIGQRLVHDAAQQLRDLGVLQPARWCRAYFSMFDGAPHHAVTVHEPE